MAVTSTPLSLLPVIAAFHCHGVLLCYFLISRKRQQVSMLMAAIEYNKTLARLRHVKKRIIRRRWFQRKPGRMDQRWRNLFESWLENQMWITRHLSLLPARLQISFFFVSSGVWLDPSSWIGVEERNTRGLADLAVEMFSVSGKVYLHSARGQRFEPAIRHNGRLLSTFQGSGNK